MSERNLKITNSGGFILVEDTVTGSIKRYSKLSEWNLKTLEIKVADGDSYSSLYDIDRVISPTITNAADLTAWIDGLVLGGASGSSDNTDILAKLDELKTLPTTINPPTVTSTTTTETIASGFWSAIIEAPTGMITGSTVEINGITYDDGFVGKEFKRIHSGASIGIVANGNNIVITEVR